MRRVQPLPGVKNAVARSPYQSRERRRRLRSRSGPTWFETGAATAATFYAKSRSATPANCNAKYSETRATGFTGGASFSSAVQNT